MVAMAIAAAVGAAVNQVSWITGQFENRAAYKKQLKNLYIDAFLDYTEMERQFKAQQKEAFKQADRADAQTTQNEAFVSADFNNQLGQISLGEQALAESWNSDAQAIASNKGNELSELASSGVRNASVNDAIEMESAQNAAQLQLAEDQARMQDKYQLQSLFNGLQDNIFQMQTARDGANDLRGSWSKGGNNYETYMNQRNRTMYNYWRQAQEIKSAISDTFFSASNFGKNALSFIGAGVSGAQQGMQIYDSASRLYNDIKTPAIATPSQSANAAGFYQTPGLSSPSMSNYEFMSSYSQMSNNLGYDFKLNTGIQNNKIRF